MRLTATLVFVVLAAAAPRPFPQDDDDDAALSSAIPVPLPVTSLIIADPTVSVPLTTSLNVPTTIPTLLPTWTPPSNLSTSRSSKHHFSHWEPIPIFSKSCDCPNLSTVAYPCWATDALQVSQSDIKLLGRSEVGKCEDPARRWVEQIGEGEPDLSETSERC